MTFEPAAFLPFFFGVGVAVGVAINCWLRLSTRQHSSRSMSRTQPVTLLPSSSGESTCTMEQSEKEILITAVSYPCKRMSLLIEGMMKYPLRFILEITVLLTLYCWKSLIVKYRAQYVAGVTAGFDSVLALCCAARSVDTCRTCVIL